MATLVLTAVRGLFGPVGAAIGALAGQAIDAEIFKPAGRQGPRVADLRVQTSSFGTQIPLLFGAMRVAGTVIWATDMKENAETSGGKGRPNVTTYSYSASFAVVLSARSIGRVSVRHYDPERDYQAGTQSAERQGAGWEQVQVDLPATLDSAGAKMRAADLLRRRMLGRRSASLARGWAALALKPGDVVALEGEGGGWRIETSEWEGMAVRLGLVAVPTRPVVLPGVADGGSGIHQPDRLVGATHLALIETPHLFDGLVDRPQLYVAASGGSSAWRGAAVLLREEDGGYAPLGSVRRGPLMGEALSALEQGTSLLFDDATSVEVQFFDADSILAPASDAALLNGANACMIGEELLQFGIVSPSGPGRWRLGRLLRGRRGTEHWTAGHAVGDAFVLLTVDALLPIADGHAVAGRLLQVAAQGLGDSTPAEASRTADGRALVPPSPVHLRLTGSAAEGIAASWIRRSRLGWGWSDEAEAPLAEEGEAYLVAIRADDNLIRSEEIFSSVWSYSASAIAADILVAEGAPLGLEVRQRGTHGLGSPAYMLLPF
ncbi:hypothetical protein BH10PLA2_BH10PLA2_00410 [soil metagenome]